MNENTKFHILFDTNHVTGSHWQQRRMGSSPISKWTYRWNICKEGECYQSSINLDYIGGWVDLPNGLTDHALSITAHSQYPIVVNARWNIAESSANSQNTNRTHNARVPWNVTKSILDCHEVFGAKTWCGTDAAMRADYCAIDTGDRMSRMWWTREMIMPWRVEIVCILCNT